MFRKKDANREQQATSADMRKFLDANPAKHAAAAEKKAERDFDIPGGPASSHEWQASISQHILVNHDSETAPAGESNNWMSQLKEESMQFLAEQRGVHFQQIYREALYKKGIEQLVDKIFGHLQRYTYEFNQVAAGTDLHVSGTISGDVTEVVRYNKFREPEETKTYFRARFSTRLMCLAIRGQGDRVDFYVVPSSTALALSKCEDDYKAIATIQVRITEQGMMWRMKDGIPSVDSLDNLCMWLFSNLIRETKESSKKEVEPSSNT